MSLCKAETYPGLLCFEAIIADGSHCIKISIWIAYESDKESDKHTARRYQIHAIYHGQALGVPRRILAREDKVYALSSLDSSATNAGSLCPKCGSRVWNYERGSTPSNSLVSSKMYQLMPAAGASLKRLGTRPLYNPWAPSRRHCWGEVWGTGMLNASHFLLSSSSPSCKAFKCQPPCSASFACTVTPV